MANGEWFAILAIYSGSCAAKNPLPFAFCLLPFAFCLLPFAFCLLPFAFRLLIAGSC
jgi:hypothetical protein